MTFFNLWFEELYSFFWVDYSAMLGTLKKLIRGFNKLLLLATSNQQPAISNVDAK
jgi:hypothetical protein